MKVLLTGVSGFMGAHVLEHLLTETDWDIVGIASWRHQGEPMRVTEALEGKDASRVRIITHDLTAPISERTRDLIGNIDVIINVASESHVDRSIYDPVPFVTNNVSLILNMLEYARHIQPKLFLQISTDEVYGPAPNGVLHKEWSTILPSNPYSASKAAQEAICISYWRTYGVPLIITNTMNLFGEMQDPEKYVARCVRLIHNGEPVTVHGTPQKAGSRFYLHARNQADALLHIIKTYKPRLYKDGGKVDRPLRFNIVGDKEINNLEMAQKVAEFMGKEFEYEFVDHHKTRPGHDRRYALDGSLLKETWTAPRDFETSLKKYIDWTLKHPQWL